MRHKGFTLVELLIVIGIIALLISILLPALSKARDQAKMMACQSNLRQIVMAALMYSNDNQGVIVPTIVWGAGQPTSYSRVLIPSGTGDVASGTANNGDDNWSILLVARGYLPNPHITWNDLPGARRSVLICPGVAPIIHGFGGYPTGGAPPDSDANAPEGIDRRASYHLSPPLPSGVPTLVVDCSYGINGATWPLTPEAVSTANPDNTCGLNFDSDTPSTSMLFVYPHAISSLPKFYPLKHMTDIRRATDTAYFFDGSSWNPYNTNTSDIEAGARVSGHRHGTSDWAKAPATSGIVNIAFFDGHVESFPRSKILNHSLGTSADHDGPSSWFDANDPITRPIWRMDQQRLTR
jgi:prepilin-type N-terminal cleavage/methylation domain-containing protein/prepilin-type processing-associated H-X9-DG protein